MTSLLWFRRDLRLSDNPALLAAADAADRSVGGAVVAVFVIDPHLWSASGPIRQSYLGQSLRSLSRDLDGRLVIQHGDPAEVIPSIARSAQAGSVHVTEDLGAYGRHRDARVEVALGSTPLVRTGSPYAVTPGRITKDDGTPYRVFTPFYRAWLRHGWRSPPGTVDVDWWKPIEGDAIPVSPLPTDIQLPDAGEAAAWARWEHFRSHALSDYASGRNRPDLDGTSRMSHHLKFGEVHARSLLADLGDDPGSEAYRRELCWRDFYADVLAGSPLSGQQSLDRRFDELMPWADGAEADRRLSAWAEGRTGFPFVDAGMRQLHAEGWIHNRVRMVVASFLVKDLHVQWQRGAREFMRWLVDGDTASNAHGWQWTAGCGTDAAPFYRVFNSVLQGKKFDPDGDYVRRYVPELRHLAGPAAHEPWLAPQGHDRGYPERIVDHAIERLTALDDYATIKRVH